MTPRLGTLVPLAVLSWLGACTTEPLDLEPLVSAPTTLGNPDLAAVAVRHPADLAAPSDLTLPRHCNCIFVFDQTNALYVFDPVHMSFTALGPLRCGNTSGGPFSMAVARDGTALVEYTTGDIYRVNTYTLECAPTQFVPNQVVDGYTFATFGMGFAADGPGIPTDTLYIVGGGSASLPEPKPHVLARVDADALTVVPIGEVGERAELTGTGSGDLWGFFASVSPHAARINKTNAQLAPDFALAELGDVARYGFAFAAFGGDFYAFLNPSAGQGTHVVRIGGSDGLIKATLPDSGLHIVGAGVSTCAPNR